MKRTAKAHWTGSIKEGEGYLTTPSEILDNTNYSFKTRFSGEEKGTNPEELLAAAHAACFTMSVSLALSEKGWHITSLDTEATLSMEGLAITGIHLSVTGTVPGMTADEFTGITKAAAQNCLISKALAIPVSLASHITL